MLNLLITFILFNFSTFANDGFSAIEAGGIVFKKTENISMKKEELFISKNNVRVKYKFKNTSKNEVKTTISFPLPGKTCGWFAKSKLIEKFSAKVNGKIVKLNKQVKAIENKKSPEVLAFGTGKDISTIVKKVGLPLDCTKVYEDKKLFKIAQKNKLAEDWGGQDPEHVQYQTEVIYYWDQVFKAGETLEIEHEYRPLAGMGLNYCPIKSGALKNKYKKTSSRLKTRGSCYVVKYILTTANTWKGPIENFKLEVDYSDKIDEVWSNYEGLVHNKNEKKLLLLKKNFYPEKELIFGFWTK